MASVLPSVIDESLFQCRLCYRPVVDPRLLPCLHVFCRTCLLRLVARQRAAAQHQTVVAEDEPGDHATSSELGDDDKDPESSSAVDQKDRGVGDDQVGSCEGQSVVTAKVAAHQPAAAISSSLTMAGNEREHEYELPQTNDYEDVDDDDDDDDRTYSNDVMVSAASHVVATKQGYVVMAGKPVTSSASSSAQVVRPLNTVVTR